MNARLLALTFSLFALNCVYAATDSKDGAPSNSMTRRAEVKKPAGVVSTGYAQKPAPTSCPAAAELKAPQLYGTWAVQFDKPPRGLPTEATLLLKPHAEFSESLSGVVSRDLSGAPGRQVPGHASKALLAGDVGDGFLSLDESSNGTNMTATWNGEVVANSCGRQIKGLWKDTSSSAPPDDPDVPFLLIKQGAW